MLRVGLTGNIASGKSSVAEHWSRLGATIIDADRLARRAVEPGTEALRQIAGIWGTSVLHPDGSLNRAALRDKVFRNAAARARLEAIVHPEVGRLRDEEMAAAAASGARIVVVDVPLLFEVGLENVFDPIVLVDAPEPVRLERLVRLRGLEPEEARRMIDAQLPSATKRKGADYVIDNDGSMAELEAEAAAVWERIVERAAAHERD